MLNNLDVSLPYTTAWNVRRSTSIAVKLTVRKHFYSNEENRSTQQYLESHIRTTIIPGLISEWFAAPALHGVAIIGCLFRASFRRPRGTDREWFGIDDRPRVPGSYGLPGSAKEERILGSVAIAERNVPRTRWNFLMQRAPDRSDGHRYPSYGVTASISHGTSSYELLVDRRRAEKTDKGPVAGER
ncbi:uncharacterized protein LOC143154837 [Ptiloglossa arizonensis]|uniref:uncharacterized protein LOC143154837 n=1 Tax=Ptiloglossa arizonensis TaxID=3350558 RepID=UPI003F9F1B85